MHWLDLIRVRPGMYLGAGPPHFGAMLDRLDTWIVGYSEAVRAHAVQDPGLDLYASFWQFLERTIEPAHVAGNDPDPPTHQHDLTPRPGRPTGACSANSAPAPADSRRERVPEALMAATTARACSRGCPVVISAPPLSW